MVQRSVLASLLVLTGASAADATILRCDPAHDRSGCSRLIIHGKMLSFHSVAVPSLGINARVTYAGVTLHEPIESHVAWIAKARVGQEEVVIVEHRNAGTQTISQFTLIAFKRTRAPRVIALPDTAGGTATVTRAGNRLEIDLGFMNRQRVVARYGDGTLEVSHPTRRADRSLPTATCKLLYRKVLPECARHRIDRADACTDAHTRLSANALRTVWTSEHHPGFDSAGLEALCEAACRQRALPWLEVLRSRACQRNGVRVSGAGTSVTLRAAASVHQRDRMSG